MAAKLALVEDFKSQQAVTRNSRAISAEMLAKLHRSYGTASLADQQALLEIERSFAEFSAVRDSASAAKLVETVEAATQRGFAWTTDLDWSTFAAHARALARYRQMLDATMSSVYEVPVALADARQQAAAALKFAQNSAVAGRFRAALLAVAVVLLLFSGHMVWKVRDYLLVIQRYNEQLEQRVETRTQELSAVNAALQAQIHERELIESQLRLAQKLESIGQLAAGIAHEINTPAQYVSDNVTFLSSAWRDLTKLIGEYATALLKGQPDAQRSEQIWAEVDVDYLLAEVPLALDQAGSGLKQISHIVRAMKDFSHPGTEGLQPTDLNRAIESTSTVARSEWKYVADLALELDPALPLVPCNVSAINQVVLNIVVNAARVHRGRAGGWRARPHLGLVAQRGTVRRHRHRGRRAGCARGGSRQDLRSVLHDEDRGQRHRPGARDRVPHRDATARRTHQRRGRARRTRREVRHRAASRALANLRRGGATRGLAGMHDHRGVRGSWRHHR